MQVQNDILRFLIWLAIELTKCTNIRGMGQRCFYYQMQQRATNQTLRPPEAHNDPQYVGSRPCDITFSQTNVHSRLKFATPFNIRYARASAPTTTSYGTLSKVRAIRTKPTCF